MNLTKLAKRSALIVVPSPTLSHATFITLPTPPHHTSPFTLTLSNLFLRSESQHKSHLHSASQQKLIRSDMIPWNGQVVRSQLLHLTQRNRDGVERLEEYVELEWDTPLRLSPASPSTQGTEVMKSLHSHRWLLQHCKPLPTHPVLPLPTPWTASQLVTTLERTAYSTYLTSSVALHSHLTSLIQNGIAMLHSVPTAKKTGEYTSLRKVVEQVGKVRKTWYGDLWDVRAEEGSLNIAYTDLDLGLHMDLVHFESPPRYQYLHSLLNRQIDGGSSYFVDTYHIAKILRHSHAREFRTLCNEDVEFAYVNGDKYTTFRRRTIETVLNAQGEKTITAVNYSPPFQGELTLSAEAPYESNISLPKHSPPLSELERLKDTTHIHGPSTTYLKRLRKLHEALSLFAALCEKEENQYEFLLKEGDCVVFDNRRVLHGRRAFRFMTQEEVGEGAMKESDGKIIAPVEIARPEEDAEKGGVVISSSLEPVSTLTPSIDSNASLSSPTPVSPPPPSEVDTRGRWLKGAYLDADELNSKWRVGHLASIKRAAAQDLKIAEARRMRRQDEQLFIESSVMESRDRAADLALREEGERNIHLE